MGWLSKILKRKAVENSIKGCGKQLNEIWNYLHGTIYEEKQVIRYCSKRTTCFSVYPEKGADGRFCRYQSCL